MTENEPLNDTATKRHAEIVTSHQNTRLTNGGNGSGSGQCEKDLANGSGISSASQTKCKNANCRNGNSLQLDVHIEAPCCRDIHGKEPPDGGMRAWLVMVSAFLCNGVIFGIINTYGVIHSLLTDRLELQGDKDASSKAGKKCNT